MIVDYGIRATVRQYLAAFQSARLLTSLDKIGRLQALSIHYGRRLQAFALARWG